MIMSSFTTASNSKDPCTWIKDIERKCSRRSKLSVLGSNILMHCYCFIDWSGSFLLFIFIGAPVVTAIVKTAKYLLLTDLCFNENLKVCCKVF